MNKMRDSIWFKIILLVVVVLVWLIWVAPSSCDLKLGASAKGETLNLGEAKNLVVKTSHNNISVVRGASSDGIVAELKGSGRSFDTVSTRMDGDTLTVSIESENKWWQFWKIGLGSRRLEVLIPNSMDLDDITVSSVSGSVEVAELDAADYIKVSSVSGSVNVDPVSAKVVEISSTSGHVDAASVKADEAKVSSVSGHVELGWFEGGSLTLSSTSGGVDLYDTGKFENLELRSVSGGIDAELGIGTAPSVNASSVSGNVEINNNDYNHRAELAGTGASVTARTTSGGIDIKF